MSDELGQRAIDLVAGVLRTATTHETRNEAVVRLLSELLALARARPGKAEQPLVLLIEGSDVFVDQELQRLDLQAWRRAQTLGEALATQDANELTILPDASVEDLAEFFREFGQAVRRRRPVETLRDLALHRVAVGRRQIDLESTARGEETSVLGQYAGLVVVCDEFVQRFRAEGTAPVVVVRRTLQTAADAMLAAPEGWLGILLAPQDPAAEGAHGARSAALAAFICGQLGASRGATSRSALLALRLATRAGEGADTAELSDAARAAALDAAVREQAMASAAGSETWPARVPVPLDCAVAALCVSLDAHVQGRGGRVPTPPAVAVSRAVAEVQRSVPVDAQLAARLRAVVGETPPGTVVGEPVAGIVGPRSAVLSGPDASVPLEAGQALGVRPPGPGPWTAWLAAGLA